MFFRSPWAFGTVLVLVSAAAAYGLASLVGAILT